MRFVILAALFAGAVLADSTTYVTDIVTITSCASTVTNCPARSTITSTTSYPVVLTGTMTDTVTGTVTCEFYMFQWTKDTFSDILQLAPPPLPTVQAG
jgi:hypothetical protein